MKSTLQTIHIPTASSSRFLASLAVAAALTLAGANTGNAQVVISTFNFTGNNGNNSAALVTGITSITPVVFGNPGVNVNVGFERSSGGGALWSERVGLTLNAAQASTFTGAITGGDYIGFTINVAPGYQLDLGSVSFLHVGQNGSGSITSNFETRTGVFVNSFAAFADIKTAQFVGTVPSLQSSSLSQLVTDAAITGATGLTGAVEIRMYFTQNSGSTTTFSNVGLDDLVFKGNVSLIPEPSSAALLLGAGMLALVRRQRAR